MTWFPEAHARIFCAAVNYADHRQEMGRGETGPNPMLFTRTVQSLVRAEEGLVKPRLSDRFDYEGELALVIGKPGRHIPRDEALSHVSGWTPFMDGTIRDWQRHTSQFTPGKNFDASGSIGPELIPAGEFGDYKARSLTTRVNGEVLQQVDIALMLCDAESLIHYISSFTELRTGDVIATGTCGGVGEKRTPQRWLQIGDVVEVEISGIPVLRNPVIAEA